MLRVKYDLSIFFDYPKGCWSFSRLDIPVQRDSRNPESLAYLSNRSLWIVIEGLGNT
jgi:hypothetical protein